MPNYLTNREMVKICDRICYRLVTTPERLLSKNPELKEVFCPLMFSNGILNDDIRGLASQRQIQILLSFVMELENIIRDSVRYGYDGCTDYDYMIQMYLSLANYSPNPEIFENMIHRTDNISLFARTTQATLNDIEQTLLKYIERPYYYKEIQTL